MFQIKDKITGSEPPVVGEYDIAKTTVIKKGQVVALSAGKVVAQAVAGTGAILGIAAEGHSGSSQALNPRDNGTKILVQDSPSAVFESEAPVITATGGTDSTIVSTSGLSASFADNDFIGGYAKLISKGESSSNTDAIGTLYPITDSDASAQELTISTAGGAVTAGDKFVIFPPYGFAKGNLDSDKANLVLSATASIPFRVCGRDMQREKVYLYSALHFYGNKNA